MRRLRLSQQRHLQHISMLPEFARDPRSGTKPLEFFLHMQTAAARRTTSCSTSEVPGAVHLKSLDKRPGDNPDKQWRIALPQQMLEETVKWFHQVMGHPREKRLRETLQQRYHHSKLRYTIDNFKCEHCQRHKLSGKGYGLLPEREL